MSSHLLQMRGLKQLTKAQAEYTSVASFTDAWIETNSLPNSGALSKVASFTDAWIETQAAKRRIMQARSHLLQMRGLKLVLLPILPSIWCRIFYRCVD